MAQKRKQPETAETELAEKKPCIIDLSFDKSKLEEEADELDLLPYPGLLPTGPMSSICQCCYGFRQLDKGCVILSPIIPGSVFGYISCKECESWVNDSKKFWNSYSMHKHNAIAIPKDKKKIKVRRTSGTVEEDWYIMQPFLFKQKPVKVFKEMNTKEEEYIYKYVKYDDLLTLNDHLQMLVNTPIKRARVKQTHRYVDGDFVPVSELRELQH